MVSSTLQESLGSLTITERIDVIDFLQRSLVPGDRSLTEQEMTMIRSRDAEMDADPSIGLTWDVLDARLQSTWG
ncbi:MAG: addiction module protein [Propionibacteriaceae bacterium]|nr:addiction module protein [Propionibacteriaceae bacterium]